MMIHRSDRVLRQDELSHFESPQRPPRDPERKVLALQRHRAAKGGTDVTSHLPLGCWTSCCHLLHGFFSLRSTAHLEMWSLAKSIYLYATSKEGNVPLNGICISILLNIFNH